MNKYKKQVNKILLNHEEKMLENLESDYSQALADIKITIKELKQSIKELELTKSDQSIINSKIYQLEYQELL